ncbi:MAG: hypothetical protein ISR65_01350 [Bacteriovoracaceae bacterium]|nr:hypothetical protein [Bacteriovoracaceae bacterium]
MSLKLAKRANYYYSFIILVLLAMVVHGIYLYVFAGKLNFSNVGLVYETSLKIDAFSKGNSIEELGKLANNSQIRRAVKILGNIEKNTSAINKIYDHEAEYKEFQTSFKELKKKLNVLLSFPELSSIMSVLLSKVTSFENLVVSNGWRTLTRIAKRAKSKINKRKKLNVNRFSYKRLKALDRGITQDIRIMRNVTEASVLSRKDKNSIILKLKTLKTEQQMINKYLSGLKEFNAVFTKCQTNFKAWLNKVTPQVAYKKIQMEKESKWFLYILISLTCLLIASFAFGLYLTKMEAKTNLRRGEQFVIDTLKEGIIPLESNLDDKLLSKSFKLELEKYHEYVQKRMSFGSIFQEAIPFSYLLLDYNLNIVWANQLFYENWDLENLDNSDASISWDYLQKFTNLGEYDPVLSALNEGIAGIYQIQIRTRLNQTSVPYEMYVAPIEYAEQKKIMIFFYPLRSLEETITNQTKSMVTPLNKTLEALSSNGFTEKFREKIKVDFENAGIPQLYGKFLDYNYYVEQQKVGLLNEVERLENSLFDQLKTMDDLQNLINDQANLHAGALRQLVEAKEGIIAILELRGDVEHLTDNSITTSGHVLKNYNELIDYTTNLTNSVSDNKMAFEKVTDVRDTIKNLKAQIEDFKSRIIESLNQALIFQRNTDANEGLDRSLKKIKLEIKGSDQLLHQLGKVIVSLDVGLSKIELLMNKDEVRNLSSLHENFDKYSELVESDRTAMNEMKDSGVSKDETMISNLKELYDKLHEAHDKINKVNVIISDNRKNFHGLENGVVNASMRPAMIQP